MLCCTLPRAPTVRALSEGREGQQQGSFSGCLAAQTKLRTESTRFQGPWLGFASPHSQRLTPWVPRKCVRDVGSLARFPSRDICRWLEPDPACLGSRPQPQLRGSSP